MITVYFPYDVDFELFKYAYEIQTVQPNIESAESLEVAINNCLTPYLCWTKYATTDNKFVEDNLKICNRNNPIVVSRNSIFLYLKKIKQIPSFQFENDDNLEEIKLLKAKNFELSGYEQLVQIFKDENLNSYLDLSKDNNIFLSLAKILAENNNNLKIVKANIDKSEFLRLKSFLPMSNSLDKYDVALIDNNDGLQVMQHCKYCIIYNENITDKIKKKCDIKSIGNFSILKFKHFKKSCCGGTAIKPKAKIKIL